MNWGQKLTVAIAGFMGFILFLVISSHGVESDLVTDDYYQQEIDYQQTIDATENADALKGELVVETTDDAVRVTLPEDFQFAVVGTVSFYRPDDASKDFTVDIPGDRRSILVPLSKLSAGQYEINVHCEYQDKAYFFKKPLKVRG